jgi:hypothetical protein
MGSLDPDPDLQSGSRSRRAKITHKNRKKLIIFIFSSSTYSLLGAEGFSCSLAILYGVNCNFLSTINESGFTALFLN